MIPYVRVTDRDGRVREFVTAGTTPEQLAKGERRRMDCMDCHNRPSHVVAPTPERAVNEAMATRRDPPDVAVHPSGGREGAEGGKFRGAAGFLPLAPGRRRSRRRGRAGHLSPQRLSGDEGHLRHLPEQHRSHRFSGLFPLSRRRAQIEGWRRRSARTAKPAMRSSSWHFPCTDGDRPMKRLLALFSCSFVPPRQPRSAAPRSPAPPREVRTAHRRPAMSATTRASRVTTTKTSSWARRCTARRRTRGRRRPTPTRRARRATVPARSTPRPATRRRFACSRR